MDVLVGSFCAPMKHYRICDGKFEFVKEISDSGPAPSYIIRSKCKKFLYCTSEIPKSLESGVCAFSCDGNEITFINRVTSEGVSPCHLCFDDSGSYIFVSNYMGGNVVVLPVSSDGSLSRACQAVSHKAPLLINDEVKIPNRSSAHVHQCIYLAPSSTILVCDLGLDTVFSYSWSRTEGDVRPKLSESSRWHCPAQAGPRHLAVHPSGGYAYLLSEIDCTLAALKLDATRGSIVPSSQYQYHPLMRSGEPTGSMNAAEVIVSQDGRFVYASNRDVSGGNRDTVSSKFEVAGRSNCSISVFGVGDDGASLTFLQQVHSRGRHPRGMTLELRGGSPVLLVANKDDGCDSRLPGGNLVCFPVDNETGLLKVESAVVTEGTVTDGGDGAIIEPTWILAL